MQDQPFAGLQSQLSGVFFRAIYLTEAMVSGLDCAGEDGLNSDRKEQENIAFSFAKKISD